MDGQSVKTTEKGAFGVLTPIKRIRGRKRHILVESVQKAYQDVMKTISV
jgi:hypothetical protein